MRKKFMAALSAAAILAVSGCSSSAKVTLGPAGGTQVSEIERYNAYIDANNVIINELDDAIYSYFSYVEYQEEFKALDPDYWCLPVSDYSLQIMLMCGKVTHKNLIDSLHYSEKLTKKKQN